MGEPRIHVAIVCASVSCPDLRKEAYVTNQLDSQLNNQMRSFLANRNKGLRIENGKLYLSSIFKWFKEDFKSRGGILSFILPYVAGEETALMESIEGNRSMPRARPPFPAAFGVWGKPSNINNVKTF